MRILYRHIAIGLLLISAVSLATFEFFLEHHRPVQSQGVFSLYHKGYGAIVYVSNADQLIYWGMSMACIASALFLAYHALGRVGPQHAF